jgi:hypothetical protein
MIEAHPVVALNCDKGASRLLTGRRESAGEGRPRPEELTLILPP